MTSGAAFLQLSHSSWQRGREHYRQSQSVSQSLWGGTLPIKLSLLPSSIFAGVPHMLFPILFFSLLPNSKRRIPSLGSSFWSFCTGKKKPFLFSHPVSYSLPPSVWFRLEQKTEFPLRPSQEEKKKRGKKKKKREENSSVKRSNKGSMKRSIHHLLYSDRQTDRQRERERERERERHQQKRRGNTGREGREPC